MAKQTFQFQTDTQKLLDIVIHSLYSSKEIFLRELISNASDALDKLRFKSLTDSTVFPAGETLSIHLESDPRKNSLTISDNGIGMSREEIIDKIGTIAKSGSKEFLELLKKQKDQTIELIGQFGVGFYSSFIVADSVTITSRAYNSTQAVRWSSAGDGNYTVEDSEKATRGTSIELTLKSEKELEQNFCDEWVLRNIVKKHSDFISYPITMRVEKEVPEKNEKGEEKKIKKWVLEELNSKEALWLKNKNDIKEEEYSEFYKHLSHDWEKPLKHIHVTAEGRMEYVSLLFIPAKRPFTFSLHDRKSSIHLYVKKVLIMDDCKDLLPDYLRFVKGMVDASDLALNVSREMLQGDRKVATIRTHLTKKVLETLSDIKKESAKSYESFWQAFGSLIKEGLHSDFGSKDKLKDLLLYPSTFGNGTTALEAYVGRMKPGQKEIYYIGGEDLEALKESPHLEKFKKNSIEVLFFSDPIDEFVVDSLADYQGKKFVSIAKGEIDLPEEASEREAQKKKESEFSDILEFMKKELADKVKDVKFSHRLTSSVACLVSDKDALSANMEKILKAAGQSAPESKRILEVNPDHKLISVMHNLLHQGKSTDKLKTFCGLIYDQTLLAEGTPLKNPIQFSEKITGVMLEALGEITSSRIITLS